MEISNSRRIIGITALVIAFLSFVQFLLYYIPSGYFYNIDILLLAASYLINFFEGLFPVLAASIIFILKGDGIKNKIFPAFFLSLTRLTYSLPHYYIYYVADVFNTSESIVLSLITSALLVLRAFLQTFICILVLIAIEKRAKKTSADRARARIFNLDDHLNLGILSCVIISFTVFFVRELIDTVEYLIDSKGTYRLDEILTIVIAYLLLLIFAAVYYLISARVKNKILSEEYEK